MNVGIIIERVPASPDSTLLPDIEERQGRAIFDQLKSDLKKLNTADGQMAERDLIILVERVFRYVGQEYLASEYSDAMQFLLKWQVERQYVWPRTFQYTDEVMLNLGWDMMKHNEAREIINALVAIMNEIELQDLFNARLDYRYIFN